MIYPKKLSSKKGQKIINISLIISVILSIMLIVINKVTTPNIHWAALTNCGIIYIWITVLYSIKKSRNIAGHVLLQTIIISLAILYIDKKIGFSGWSINIGVPIVLIIANIAMLILTLISYKKYIRYAICQLLIVLMSIISIVFITNKLIEFQILSIIALIISILNLAITFILCYKDIKEAIIRKFHM